MRVDVAPYEATGLESVDRLADRRTVDTEQPRQRRSSN
jgi:hypothetical protein